MYRLWLPSSSTASAVSSSKVRIHSPGYSFPVYRHVQSMPDHVYSPVVPVSRTDALWDCKKYIYIQWSPMSRCEYRPIHLHELPCGRGQNNNVDYLLHARSFRRSSWKFRCPFNAVSIVTFEIILFRRSLSLNISLYVLV